MSAVVVSIPFDEPVQMAVVECNDLGNAKRLVRLAKGLLLWVETIGWVAFDGKRWSSRDGELRANQLAHEVVAHIGKELRALAAIAGDAGKLKETFGREIPIDFAGEQVGYLRKHALASGNASRIAGMLKEAKTLLPARPDEFDQDLLAFNVQNGTIRFREAKGGGWEVRFSAHDPDDRMMQLGGVAYAPEAPCPEWQERMRLIQPEKDQRSLLQQRYGYMMTGLTDEQKWFIDQGQGADGKSLTNRVMSRVWGDYYRHAEIGSFLQGQQRSGADHSADMARLRGDIRFVLADEPPLNATWNGSRLKQITGSEISARGVGEKETLDFEPRWKLIVEVNPLPKVPNDDHGFWRRVVPIPWSYQFDMGGVASQPFSVLVAHFLEKEGSGILNWCIAGALKWLETRRLPMSATSIEFLDNYKQSATPFGEWIMDRADTRDRTVMTASGDLYRDFKAWAEQRELDKVPTQAAFGRFLTNRQHLEKKDRRGNRFRRGIRLKDDWTNASSADDAADYGNSRAGGWGAARPIGPQDDIDWDDRP